MMKKAKILLVVFSATFFNLAQAANTYQIGDGWLDDNGNPSSISWDRCQEADDIRIKVNKESVLKKIVIKLESGQEKIITKKIKLEKNGKTEWFDLGKGTQCVSSIYFNSVPKQPMTRIEVQGRIK